MRTLAELAAGLAYFIPPPEPDVVTLAPQSPLGGLAYRPTLYRRNAVSWVSVRSWRADAKGVDLARLKLCKAAVDQTVIGAAAGEIAGLLRLLFGHFAGWIATSVACGHSRRPDCFGKRLGGAVADELGLGFLEVFEDRFVDGVSHPKEFSKLPPLMYRDKPAAPVLVVDDIATSGWHVEEALGMIRARYCKALWDRAAQRVAARRRSSRRSTAPRPPNAQPALTTAVGDGDKRYRGVAPVNLQARVSRLFFRPYGCRMVARQLEFVALE